MLHKYRVVGLSLFALLFMVSFGLSQNAYHKGGNVIHGGLGFGLAGLYGSSTLPPITLGFEHGLEDKISLGGIFGFAGSKQTYFGGEWSYSYILIGARGGYHFLENNSQWDAYGGVTLGYAIVSVSASGGGSTFVSAGGSYLLFGFYAGGRYYVSPQFAVFGEVGYGVGFFTVGVAFKL